MKKGTTYPKRSWLARALRMAAFGCLESNCLPAWVPQGRVSGGHHRPSSKGRADMGSK